MPPVNNVKCPGCKRNTRFSSHYEPVKGFDGIMEAGIKCRWCGHVQVSYYDTPEIVAKRGEVAAARQALAREKGQRSALQRAEELKKVIEDFNILFDAVQSEVREKMGG